MWRTLSKPFFAATSLALFVKSPKVLLLTYVKSSNVFLLTPAAVLLASKALFEASWTDFVASPMAFFVCCVNCLIFKRKIKYFLLNLSIIIISFNLNIIINVLR